MTGPNSHSWWSHSRLEPKPVALAAEVALSLPSLTRQCPRPPPGQVSQRVSFRNPTVTPILQLPQGAATRCTGPFAGPGGSLPVTSSSWDRWAAEKSSLTSQEYWDKRSHAQGSGPLPARGRSEL